MHFGRCDNGSGCGGGDPQHLMHVSMAAQMLRRIYKAREGPRHVRFLLNYLPVTTHIFETANLSPWLTFQSTVISRSMV